MAESMAGNAVFVTGSRLLDRLLIYRSESQLGSLRLNNEKLNRHDTDKEYLLSFAECESGIDTLGRLVAASGAVGATAEDGGYRVVVEDNPRITFGTLSKWFRRAADDGARYFMKESLGQTPGHSGIAAGGEPHPMGCMDDETARAARVATVYDMEREDVRSARRPGDEGCFAFDAAQYAAVETILLRTRFGKRQVPSQTIDELRRTGLDARTVLYTTVDDLRRAGFNIRKGLSWEQLTFETCRAIMSAPCLSSFLAVVVKYDNEGFLVYRDGRASIAYYAQMMEGDMARSAPGRVFGSTIAVEAGLTHVLMTASGEDDLDARLCKGMAVGLSASHELLRLGYLDEDGLPRFPYEQVAHRIVEKERLLRDARDLKAMFGENGMAHIALRRDVISDELGRMRRDRLVARPAEPKQRYSFCYHLIGEGPHSMEEFARRLVQQGTPAAIRDVGHLRVGSFVTLDREEAEEIRSIQNLLLLYIQDDAATQPFSISIFGQPGSGKSFVVKQIAKSFHLGDQNTFTFNLSQMTSLENLIEAFHQVRDSCLKGNIPVVFFDEFDSRFEGNKLGWLKYFLSPMQDGTFLEGALEHTIGKSVFVFAGGTCHSMKEFARLADPDAFDADEDAADTKAQDFISRLKGYLNVLGINPDGGDAALEQHLRLLDADGGMNDFDESLYLRRALLLRSFIEQKAGLVPDERINVEENVLNAFLRVWRYTHGSRSMETLIQTSDIVRGYNFSASCIYNNNLDMHVSPDFLYHLDHETSE